MSSGASRIERLTSVLDPGLRTPWLAVHIWHFVATLGIRIRYFSNNVMRS